MLVRTALCLSANGPHKIAMKKTEADIRHCTGPAHAVYFGTYEVVKDLAGGNVDSGHHPFAAG